MAVGGGALNRRDDLQEAVAGGANTQLRSPNSLTPGSRKGSSRPKRFAQFALAGRGSSAGDEHGLAQADAGSGLSHGASQRF